MGNKSLQHDRGRNVSFLRYNYIMNTPNCQSLNEIFGTFIEKWQYRNTYTPYTIPSLSEFQRGAWDECCDTIWIDDNDTVQAINSCRNRLCAICNWRSSRKKYSQTVQMINQIEHMNLQYIFATYTIRNPSIDKLNESIDKMMESINRMQSSRRWKQRVLGYIRSMEITYNTNENTWHPHLHYILLLPPDYYTNPDYYLSTYEWRTMWERAARLDYTSQVQIQPIQRGENLPHAIAEISKYALKLGSVVECQNTQIIYRLKTAIAHRRLYAVGGILKPIYKQIKNTEKSEYNNSVHNNKKWHCYQRGADGRYHKLC